MRIALDTNRYTDLCSGDRKVLECLQYAESIYLPFVVLGELRAGFAMGDRGARNERVLQNFLAKPGVAVLYADEATTRHYASIYRQLRTQGTPIPANDLWIAACVIQHGLALYTRDRHFQHLAQINLV